MAKESKYKGFKELPIEYRNENKRQGRIEKLQYKILDLEGDTCTKNVNVYLPYGYNEVDKNKKYNILYLMHGGGENENLIFGGSNKTTEFKNILDNMIYNGDIEPIIVVTPTFYNLKDKLVNKVNENKELEFVLPVMETENFHKELVNNLIPFIETKYNTYVKSGKEEDLKDSRSHRAFGGFSMGSVATWNAFINCLDYFKYFIPLSGDCWILSKKASGSMAKETAKYLEDSVKMTQYTWKDYYLFCACGKLDIAYPNMEPQIDAMKKLKDTFIYSNNKENGNFYFIVNEEGVHTWYWINQFIYNILPDLFI